MRSLLRLGLSLLLAGCGSGSAGTPDAGARDAGPVLPSPGFAYTISVSDPDHALPTAADALKACAEGGLVEWGRYVNSPATLSVEIRVVNTTTGRFAGASTSNVPAGNCKNTPSPCFLVEEQAIHRLRTGLADPAMTSAPDVHIDVSPDYWTREVWVDPAPLVRTATVPSDHLDCVSLFTHELGHAFGMVGFRALDTFLPTSSFQSLYDDAVRVGSGTLTFEGPLTVAAFGPIPLTRTSSTQNVYHYADPSVLSAYDGLLMNGISFQYGHRYFVGKLDALIVKDLGLPVQTLPQP